MSAGRRTKYSKKLVNEICEELSTGKNSVADVCLKLGITTSTFYHWKSTKSEFSDAIERAEAARREAFKEMANSGLAKLLDVHEYEEVTTEYENDKKGKPIIKSQKRIKKKIMPHPTAVIFALTNREPNSWKNRQNIEAKGDFNHNIGFGDFLMDVNTDEDSEEGGEDAE